MPEVQIRGSGIEAGFDTEHRAGPQLRRHLFFDQQLVAAALDDI